MLEILLFPEIDKFKTKKEVTSEEAAYVDSKVQAMHHALGLPDRENRGAVNSATSITYKESSTIGHDGVDIFPEDTTRNNGIIGSLLICMSSSSYLRAVRMIRTTRMEISL